MYVNKYFKKCFGVCAARNKVLGNIEACSKMTRDDVNVVLLDALEMFWNTMEKGLEKSGTNMITKSCASTGMRPFNKNCKGWTNAIATVLFAA